MARHPTTLILACAGLTILVGCTCNKDKVVGRYASADCVLKDSPNSKTKLCHDVIPEADVSVTSISTPTTAAGTSAQANPNPAVAPAAGAVATTAAGGTAVPAPLSSATNFPDHALAEYIKVIADPKLNQAAVNALRTNLAAPLKAAPASSAAANDQTILHRTLIVTIGKDALKFNPADRIEAAEVVITLKGNATFASWDTAATMYTTINAGTVQLTQTRNSGQSLTAGAAPPLIPITASLGLTGSQGETRVENYNATSQAESLTVSVNGNSMRIRRQGGIGIDLTGNMIIKTDIIVPPEQSSWKSLFSISGNYLNKQNRWTPPQQLSLKTQLVHIPANPVDIMADVALTYTMRHIVSGDETMEEKDDVVHEITTINSPVNVVLVPGRQVSSPLYTFWSDEGKGAPVFVSRPTSARNTPLCFDSYEDAQDLLTYIQKGNSTHPQILGTATLGFSGLHGFVPLKSQDLTGMIVDAGCP